jgi:tRNA(Ile2) C34 agmatinyltransferase TiaS
MTDYHDFTTQDMSKEERRKLNVGDIYSNAVECTHCGETIRSHNQHDYRSCKCGETFVDGGSWYSRHSADAKSKMVIFDDVDVDKEE